MNTIVEATAENESARIVVVRHGQTEWSRSGRHTGRSDIPLTDRGRRQACDLAPRLAAEQFALGLSSPLRRAAETARLAGLTTSADDDLAEWDYGVYEGRTSDEIEAEQGERWVVWDADGRRYPAPGESLGEVAARVDRVLARAHPVVAAGQDVVLVAHGHLLRILASRWIGAPAATGQNLALGTAAFGVLGLRHGRPVIRHWNVTSLPDRSA